MKLLGMIISAWLACNLFSYNASAACDTNCLKCKNYCRTDYGKCTKLYQTTSFGNQARKANGMKQCQAQRDNCYKSCEKASKPVTSSAPKCNTSLQRRGNRPFRYSSSSSCSSAIRGLKARQLAIIKKTCARNPCRYLASYKYVKYSCKKKKKLFSKKYVYKAKGGVEYRCR